MSYIVFDELYRMIYSYREIFLKIRGEANKSSLMIEQAPFPRLETHKRRGNVAPPSLSPLGPPVFRKSQYWRSHPRPTLTPTDYSCPLPKRPFLHSLFSPICPPPHPGSGLPPFQKPTNAIYTPPPPQSASTSIWCASIFHLRDNTRWNDLIKVWITDI